MENQAIDNQVVETPTTSEEKLYTKEEMSKIISSRVNETRESVTKEFASKYTDYEELKAFKENAEKENQTIGSSLEEANAEIEKLKAQVAKYETDSVKKSIAKEFGIPEELANRLSGANADEWKQDAERLAPFVNVHKEVPLKQAETPPAMDGVTAQFLKNNPRIKI